jgi:hypothetical protein
MKYSVDINRNIGDFAHCLQWVNENVNNIWDWRISVNAGGIDYGIYFNFDIKNKELEICNQPQYDESLGLAEIIEEINEYYSEEYDDE